MPRSAAPERVAVIVVHGIADHVRGATATAVASQLAMEAGGQTQRTDIPIEVAPVDPAVPFDHWSPKGWIERINKSFRQSLRSDFLDPHLGARPDGEATKAAMPLRSSAVRGPQLASNEAPVDHGVRFTDYLFAKSKAERDTPRRAPPASRHFEMPCVEVRSPGRTSDVYEMHWADLSRLSGGASRIVTELFTMLFHLSKLGADTVALAEAALSPSRTLTWLSRFHRWGHWLFTHGMALLFLQLLVCVLLLMPAVLVNGQERAAGMTAAVLLGSAVGLWWVYRGAAWVGGFWMGAASVLALGALAWWQPVAGAWGALLLWLAMLLVAYQRFVSYAEERFRAVYGVGWALLVVTLVSLAWGAAVHGVAVGEAGVAQRSLAGVLRAMEVILLGQVMVWVLMAVLVAAAVVAGEVACHAGPDSAARSQTVVTARLSLFVSVGIFLAFVMAAWALLAKPLEALVEGFRYQPWWFVDGAVGEPASAAHFLAQRFTSSTETFSLVSLMLLVLAGFVALVFLPSVLVELRLSTWFSATRLGHWLTAGYRAIDRLVRWWSWVLVGVLAVVATVLVGSQLVRLGLALPWLGRLRLPVGTWSGELLARLVLFVAGGAVGLVAIGSGAFKRLQALRTPLDAALDVDNHFREFPRRAIPRVMIFERFIALLEQVDVRRYDRVVIVSLSQGSVITTDLLRYLQRRHRLFASRRVAEGDRLVKLGEILGAADIRLLTVGSPLRQLYAQRFPCQYGWVLGEGPQHAGPEPRADVNVARWVNLWGAGDYVGRWLWTPARDDTMPALAVDPAAYAGVVTERAPDYADVCIGAEAHTHYAELDQRAVARALAALVDSA